MSFVKPLPENVGKWSSLFAYLNKRFAQMEGNRLVSGKGTKITRTSAGTTVSVDPGTGGGGGGETPNVVRWG